MGNKKLLNTIELKELRIQLLVDYGMQIIEKYKNIEDDVNKIINDQKFEFE